MVLNWVRMVLCELLEIRFSKAMAANAPKQTSDLTSSPSHREVGPRSLHLRPGQQSFVARSSD